MGDGDGYKLRVTKEQKLLTKEGTKVLLSPQDQAAIVDAVHIAARSNNLAFMRLVFMGLETTLDAYRYGDASELLDLKVALEYMIERMGRLTVATNPLVTHCSILVSRIVILLETRALWGE